MAFDEWRNFRQFEPAAPRAVAGGIKAASRSGSFGESWWAKRWIATLERFNIGTRLKRGRTYARKGQVLSIDVASGLVQARVQGSRFDPYSVRIEVKALTAEDWKRLVEHLGAQAIFAAKLLAGEMPDEIESVFTAAGLSLFPEKSSELSTACSCPDWSNPCKHVAAVYYLLGEVFDSDPFLIFRMRGMDREQFTKALGESRVEAGELEESALLAAEPLPADPAAFWSAKPLPTSWAESTTPSKQCAALPRRLGNLPFWRGGIPFLTALEPIYESAARNAERLLFES